MKVFDFGSKQSKVGVELQVIIVVGTFIRMSVMN